jgi:hypothetical protein
VQPGRRQRGIAHVIGAEPVERDSADGARLRGEREVAGQRAEIPNARGDTLT